MRFQPVAIDLRRVVATIKVNSALERIADKAASIARKASKLHAGQTIPEIEWLRPLGEMTTGIFQESATAFETRNVEMARGLKAKDREIDAECARVGDLLGPAIGKGGEMAAALLNLVFIGRHLERIGDYSTNIAEDIIFAEAAEDIRHSGK